MHWQWLGCQGLCGEMDRLDQRSISTMHWHSMALALIFVLCNAEELLGSRCVGYVGESVEVRMEHCWERRPGELV